MVAAVDISRKPRAELAVLVQAEANPGLALIGYLLSMYNKALSVHVTYEAYLRELHGDDAFRAVIPLAKDFKEAVTLRKPVVEHKPRSAASKAVDRHVRCASLP